MKVRNLQSRKGFGLAEMQKNWFRFDLSILIYFPPKHPLTKQALRVIVQKNRLNFILQDTKKPFSVEVHEYVMKNEINYGFTFRTLLNPLLRLEFDQDLIKTKRKRDLLPPAAHSVWKGGGGKPSIYKFAIFSSWITFC